jgi:hypothetical protein
MLTRSCMAALAALFIFSSPCRLVAAGKQEPQLNHADQRAVSVSLVTLIANPQQYEGKVVRVIGFVQLEFEGNAIYLHEEDFRRAITENGLWLDVPTGFRGWSAGSYAIVEGTFTGRQHGHMGLFSGEIQHVTRLEPWLGR